MNIHASYVRRSFINGHHGATASHVDKNHRYLNALRVRVRARCIRKLPIRDASLACVCIQARLSSVRTQIRFAPNLHCVPDSHDSLAILIYHSLSESRPVLDESVPLCHRASSNGNFRDCSTAMLYRPDQKNELSLREL